MGRKKKTFNVDNLSHEEIHILSVQLGEKVRHICDKAVLKANKILNKFGMECKMSFQIQAIGTFPEKPNNLEKSNLINEQ